MPEITVPADQVFPILRSNILVDGFHFVIDLENSCGTTMVNAVTGEEYLDCYSYFATLPIGHNHPKMKDEGFQASLLRAALANPANSDVYSGEYAGFVKTFREIAVPDTFKHLFFIAGGTLAVENAMKAAFDWKTQKNRDKGINNGADKVLHFRDAFHGRSGYTLTVTNTDPTKTDDYPKFDWPRVSNPKIEFPIDEEKVAAAEDRSVAEIETAFERDPHGIAAILIEPIQSEGGDNHFRPDFLHRLRGLADYHEALLIYDEVQTGMGITGSMWAYEQLGPIPDIIAFGKKSQVCGMMSTGRIDDVETNVFKVSSRINSTWGGNLVDMVRCARYLQIIKEDRLVDNVVWVGKVFLEGLQAIEADFDMVTNARGRGFLLAIDFPNTAQRSRVRKACWEAGLATLACGPRSLRFRPTLTFSEVDTQRAMTILRGVLAREAK
jgi:L-lysine 6-transaminase